jgi:ABC-2 type transport system ATP-binding protein
MLELKNVTKKYGDLVAVNGVDLTINKGEFFGLLGPNGAGKTTTVRMISTITPKTSGEIKVDGVDIDRNLTEIKIKIGVVPQQNNLEVELSAWENLEIHGILYKIPKKERRERINELLEFIGLTDRKDDKVYGYSGGMKRKIMIAKALMHRPEIMLLDEPTVGLDAAARRKMWDLLKSLKEQGLTVLLTTHYIEEAEMLCDRVGMIDLGKMIQIDTPKNLVSEVGEMVVDNFTNGSTVSEFFDSREEANNYANSLDGTVNIRPSNLEDVFVKYTNRRVVS